MMESLYQQALSLYNQGDYEGAWNLLHNANLKEQREILLFKECEKLSLEQTILLIKSYIEAKEYEKAKQKKMDYYTKHGFHASIEAIEIPEGRPLSTGNNRVEVVSMSAPTVTMEQSPKKFKGKVFMVLIASLVLILGAVSFFYLSKENIDWILNTQTSINKTALEVNTNLNNLKSNMQYEIITVDENKNIAYCLDKDKKYLYVRYNLETNQIEEKELSPEECSGIQYLNEAFYVESFNSIIFVGDNGWNGMGAGIYALRLNLSTNKLSEICFAREVKRVGDYLLAQQMELVVEGDCSANNDYNFYDEYYDFKGNLIDGKTIRGTGAIGKYPIEMSFHTLAGKVSGWYKYKGHTNYMTIKGKVDDSGAFDFMEFNDKMEHFGRFVGQADFEQQTLSGTWMREEKQLNFFISKE